jgi:hypothetical protein
LFTLKGAKESIIKEPKDIKENVKTQKIKLSEVRSLVRKLIKEELEDNNKIKDFLNSIGVEDDGYYHIKLINETDIEVTDEMDGREIPDFVNKYGDGKYKYEKADSREKRHLGLLGRIYIEPGYSYFIEIFEH